MAKLSKLELLTPSDLKCETVQIGPLGGEVEMQELSVGERLRVLKRFQGIDVDDPEQAMRGMMALVVASLREDGAPMFPEAERAEAIEGLMQRSSKSVEELITHCQRIQGMGADAVKDTVKNSEASPSDSLSSGSPETSDTRALGL